MRQFVLKSSSGNECVFGFNEGNLLVVFRADEEMANDALDWLHANMPYYRMALYTLAEKHGFEVTELAIDLSFEAFWEAYKYKVGNKSRVVKAWDKLSDADKVKVLDSLGKYKRWLQIHPTIEKAFPETYLNQRRFESEFK
jgi:hypothetical protein